MRWNWTPVCPSKANGEQPKRCRRRENIQTGLSNNKPVSQRVRLPEGGCQNLGHVRNRA